MSGVRTSGTGGAEFGDGHWNFLMQNDESISTNKIYAHNFISKYVSFQADLKGDYLPDCP